MKNVLRTTLCATLLLAAATGFAQEKKDTTKFTKKVEKGVKKGANATASTSAKVYSKVIDKTYKGKMGPDGQTIYITNKNKYYYVDSKGGRVYVTKAELKDKPED
jgi:hypothetical protein